MHQCSSCQELGCLLPSWKPILESKCRFNCWPRFKAWYSLGIPKSMPTWAPVACTWFPLLDLWSKEVPWSWITSSWPMKTMRGSWGWTGALLDLNTSTVPRPTNAITSTGSWIGLPEICPFPFAGWKFVHNLDQQWRCGRHDGQCGGERGRSHKRSQRTDLQLRRGWAFVPCRCGEGDMWSSRQGP